LTSMRIVSRDNYYRKALLDEIGLQEYRGVE